MGKAKRRKGFASLLNDSARKPDVDSSVREGHVVTTPEALLLLELDVINLLFYGTEGLLDAETYILGESIDYVDGESAKARILDVSLDYADKGIDLEAYFLALLMESLPELELQADRWHLDLAAESAMRLAKAARRARELYRHD